jgi:hypothetical protein
MLNVEVFNRKDVDEIDLGYGFSSTEKDSFKSHNNVVGLTARKDKDIVVMGGVHVLWQGVGEGWIMVSKNAHKMPVTVARYADEFFDVIMDEANLQRVQASVHSEDAQAIRFARWLGFENEGLMKKYGPDGKDYYRMARVI